MWKIYTLTDPRTDAVRYIGTTGRTLECRLGDHIRQSRWGEKTHRANWIRQLLAADLLPVISMLEITEDKTREIYWIREYRERGIDLVNGTAGGDGWGQWTEERRLAHGDRMRGRIAMPETRAKLSAAQRGRVVSAETRELLRAYNLGKKHGPLSPETKEKMRAAKLGHQVSAETRAKISARLMGRPTRRKRDHCPAGHPYDATHTFINVRGSQECRTCRKNRDHARYLARTA